MAFTEKTRRLILHGSTGDPSEPYYLDFKPSETDARFNITARNVADDTSADAFPVYFKTPLAIRYTGQYTRLDTKIFSMDASIGQNTTDITANTAAISATSTSVAVTNANLAAEIANRTAADTALQSTIDANMAANGVLINNVAADLVTEENARAAADLSNSLAITTVSDDLAAEITLARANEATLTANVATNTSGLATEITDRTNAVANLQNQLDTLIGASPANLDTLTEIVALLNAGDGTLATSLATLQSQVDSQRSAADARLSAIEATLESLQNP